MDRKVELMHKWGSVLAMMMKIWKETIPFDAIPETDFSVGKKTLSMHNSCSAYEAIQTGSVQYSGVDLGRMQWSVLSNITFLSNISA